jgi:hypothetical protein
MPYSTGKGTGEDKGKTCVYKKKPDGSRGKKVGCTDGDVKDYLAALHMHADESIKRNNVVITKSRLKQIVQEELRSVLHE